MELCNCHCVIHRTNRARCALNKEILELLNEEVFLEHAVIELVHNFDEKSIKVIQKVNRPLKCHSNFFWWGGGGGGYT